MPSQLDSPLAALERCLSTRLIPSADFLAAETATSLDPRGATACGETYRRVAELDHAELRRLARVRALMEIGWVAVHLSLLTPERIAPKRFAEQSFDLCAHLARHGALARARLARAVRLIPELVTN